MGKHLLNTFILSIGAGIMIAIGGTVFIAAENKVVGSFFFAVALLTICCMGLYLFTGKIGLIGEKCTKCGLAALPVGLFGNLATCYVIGLVVGEVKPAYRDKALTVCDPKLTLPAISVVFLAIMCGILMYVAVYGYKEKGSPLLILMAIPTFILCGFEHCIADAFYFGAAGIFSLDMLVFTLCAIIGNSIGGLILPLLSKAAAKFKE